jgi:hypothetical protein
MGRRRAPGLTPAGGAGASDPLRGKIKEANGEIARLVGDKVHDLDIGGRILQADASLSEDLIPDYLHPDKKGFPIWADALLPRLKEMLRRYTRGRVFGVGRACAMVIARCLRGAASSRPSEAPSGPLQLECCGRMLSS